MATTESRMAGGSDHHPEIDWEAAERSPEFRELIKKKRAFVVPGYAPDFMGREFITDGMTVGYALALTQFLMVWGLGWWYLRKADREFDPLAQRAAEVALAAGEARRAPEGRFERGAAEGTARTDEEARR